MVPRASLNVLKASRRASFFRHPPNSWTLTVDDDDAIVVECGTSTFFVAETTRCTLAKPATWKRRLAKHNGGRASTYTAAPRPLTLVYLERYANREQALRREKQLKGWTRAKKEALILTDRALLKRL
jgi:putative endonuclease